MTKKQLNNVTQLLSEQYKIVQTWERDADRARFNGMVAIVYAFGYQVVINEDCEAKLLKL